MAVPLPVAEIASQYTPALFYDGPQGGYAIWHNLDHAEAGSKLIVERPSVQLPPASVIPDKGKVLSGLYAEADEFLTAIRASAELRAISKYLGYVGAQVSVTLPTGTQRTQLTIGYPSLDRLNERLDSLSNTNSLRFQAYPGGCFTGLEFMEALGNRRVLIASEDPDETHDSTIHSLAYIAAAETLTNLLSDEGKDINLMPYDEAETEASGLMYVLDNWMTVSAFATPDDRHDACREVTTGLRMDGLQGLAIAKQTEEHLKQLSAEVSALHVAA